MTWRTSVPVIVFIFCDLLPVIFNRLTSDSEALSSFNETNILTAS